MKRLAAAVALAPLAILALVLILAVATTSGNCDGTGSASETAQREIPADLLPVYQNAAATCPGLPWDVLAAVGAIESSHARGTADPATGDTHPPILGPALDGTNAFARIPDATMPTGWAHALGPMQFLSTTWAEWGRLAPGRPTGAQADPHNAWDAIYSAAAYLCGSAGEITDLRAALFRYNNSYAYVDDILTQASEYSSGTAQQGSCEPELVSVEPVTGGGQLAWPVQGPVTSGYGHRVHPIHRDWSFHAGIDISAAMSTPIHAPAAGTVRRAGTEGGCGNSVTIDHGDGLVTRYCHFSVITTAIGSPLTAGETFALVGSTGDSTGPHLHFEVYDRDQIVDPLNYLAPQS
ncbi:MAG: peptidoglycan DD-metalloendopeptidase family protein [Acidimicrobiia bacterium]